ncbi:hypothetical protein KCTC52924_01809 [Arenibacter antarcticus]|uniref:Uncharacterized protein n=1 Tax=Arenibacter antarcticus TaxID=2040469 RepID=A0ABW5VHK5_9FLAO|nr:hypothetical protein [Arenibacter sp. H213]MCM4166953.1 hypothetical protein [Arenibacter sp. H213]
MKQVFRKLISLLLAFFIFAATVSWTVEIHYCLGHLVDIALFQKAESCGMNIIANQGVASINLESLHCCSDEVISIKGLEDLTYSVKDFKLALPFVFTVPLNTQIHFLEANGLLPIPIIYSPPPIFLGDIHVLQQVFLI